MRNLFNKFFKQNGKRALSAALSLALAFSVFAIAPKSASAAQDPALKAAQAAAAQAIAAKSETANKAKVSDKSREAIENIATLSKTGLVGFDGDYALPEFGNVNVIVLLDSEPAETQIAQAFSIGLSLSADTARLKAEADHALFTGQLAGLFARQSRGVGGGYTVNFEYYDAVNGFALNVPANKVEALAGLSTVKAVYPDEWVYLDPIESQTTIADQAVTDASETVTAYIPKGAASHAGTSRHNINLATVVAAQDSLESAVKKAVAEKAASPDYYTEPAPNPPGGALGRFNSGADDLHDESITGKGVTVAVLDTGIDYNHPAFSGAFYTQNEMNARSNTSAKPPSAAYIDGLYYGRNYVNNISYGYGDYTVKGDGVQQSEFDPMETTKVGWRETEYDEQNANGSDFWTDHGTHVSGTIAARSWESADPDYDVLGIAPEAKLFVYRVLGPYGSGRSSSILAGLNQVASDRPDVINLSLGGGANNAFDIEAIAINNLVINYDVICVLAAGNAGDETFTVHPPGLATGAITVGALTEPDLLPNDSDYTDMKFSYGKSTPKARIIDNGSGVGVSNGHTPPNGDGSYNLGFMPLITDVAGVNNASNVVPGLGSGTYDEWLALIKTLTDIDTEVDYGTIDEWLDYVNDSANEFLIDDVEVDISTVKGFIESLYYYGSDNDYGAAGYYLFEELSLDSLGEEELAEVIFELLGYVYGIWLDDLYPYVLYPDDIDDWSDDDWDDYYDFLYDDDDNYADFLAWIIDMIDDYDADLDGFFDFVGEDSITDTSDLLIWINVGKTEYAAEYLADIADLLPGCLDGYVIVVGRGQTFADTHDYAYYFGAAAVILVNRVGDPSANMAIDTCLIPMLVAPNATGNAWFTEKTEAEIANRTIKFGFDTVPRDLVGFSGRGPVGGSFEIKPDIDAHGDNVLSTLPYFMSVEEDPDDYSLASGYMSGTSMASPNVAGMAALLKQYSIDKGFNWKADDIKVRLMNSATQVDIDGEYSVFEVGSGYPNVYNAANATNTAYVNYNGVYTNFANKNAVTSLKTGSLSFGGVNTWAKNGDEDGRVTNRRFYKDDDG